MRKKQAKQEDSNTLTVEDLSKSVMDTGYVTHLEEKCVQMTNKYSEAVKVNQELISKIKHLEELFMSQVDNKATKLILTLEEMIADFQIQRLLEVAKERTLTLDETRQYDLFVKNKRLSANDPTVIEGQASRVADIKDVKQLADIARLKLEE